jgi:hypothetical protein
LVQPEFGARHAIAYTEAIDDFFVEMNTELAQIVTTVAEPNAPIKEAADEFTGNLDIDALEAEVDYLLSDDREADEDNLLMLPAKRQKRLFRVYDDPRRVGISVLERRMPRTYAQKHRIRWNPNDVGRIKGEIRNEIARMDLAGRPLDATFTDVVRLGDADENNARKLGLVLDQESDVAEFIVREHEIVVNGISGTLKRFRHPYSDFIPHWTVARINKEASRASMSNSIKAVRAMLPFTVQLQSINLFSQQELVIDDY